MRKWIMIVLVLVLVAVAAYYFYPEPTFPAGATADRLVITKSQRTLKVYARERLLKTYTVSLGRNPLGNKEQEGDKRTPEGQYIIHDKNPNSAYYKNLGISYPNEADMARAKRKHVDPGGQIKIHGLRNGMGWIGKLHRLRNWTAGCIAVTDSEMEELYQHVPVGTPVIIEP